MSSCSSIGASPAFRWLYRRGLAGEFGFEFFGCQQAAAQVFGQGLDELGWGQAEHIIYHLPLAENYFWRVYVTGEYTIDCCPRYLESLYFDRLKSLIDRISFHTDSVQCFLKKSSRAFSHFVLLDHMDWLASHRFNELEAEWQAILDNARPNAKLLWRSLGLKTDFVDRVRIRSAGSEYTLADLIQYDRVRAEELIKQERVNAYGSLYIATIKGQGTRASGRSRS